MLNTYQLLSELWLLRINFITATFLINCYLQLALVNVSK